MPLFYFEIEAAKVHGLSTPQLRKAENYAELMEQAATYTRGKEQGEMDVRCNATFKKMVKEYHEKSKIE